MQRADMEAGEQSWSGRVRRDCRDWGGVHIKLVSPRLTTCYRHPRPLRTKEDCIMASRDFKDDVDIASETHNVVVPVKGANVASHMDPERRKIVEKSLKRKLDSRFVLFVAIYIMNYLDSRASIMRFFTSTNLAIRKQYRGSAFGRPSGGSRHQQHAICYLLEYP